MGSDGHFSRLLIIFAIVFSVSSAAVIADELPEGAKLIKKVEPVYPDAARQAHISGTVVARVTISTKGEVTDVQPVRGRSMLNDAAIDAVWQWQFSPSSLYGRAVPSTAMVEVLCLGGILRHLQTAARS